MKCPNCSKSTMKPAKVSTSRIVAGRKFVADVDGHRCPGCRETSVSLSAMLAFETGIARSLAHHGPITGETFRFLRAAIPMPSVELARLLGVAPETITRWEKGTREVDEAAWFVVGDLLLDAIGGTEHTRLRLVSSRQESRTDHERVSPVVRATPA